MAGGCHCTSVGACVTVGGLPPVAFTIGTGPAAGLVVGRGAGDRVATCVLVSVTVCPSESDRPGVIAATDGAYGEVALAAIVNPDAAPITASASPPLITCCKDSTVTATIATVPIIMCGKLAFS